MVKRNDVFLRPIVKATDGVVPLKKDFAFIRHPFLYTMWPEHESKWAAHATHQWQADSTEPGQIYLICSKDGVIGLTGWFKDTENSVGIRWHCVHSRFRGQGVSQAALALLIDSIPKQYRFAYESATEQAVNHFLKCGFTVVKNRTLGEAIKNRAGYDGTPLVYVLRKSREL